MADPNTTETKTPIPSTTPIPPAACPLEPGLYWARVRTNGPPVLSQAAKPEQPYNAIVCQYGTVPYLRIVRFLLDTPPRVTPQFQQIDAVDVLAFGPKIECP